MVAALRNSVSVSQPRRTTTISWLQADNPPPKLDSAIWLNVRARSQSVGRSDVGSLMDEFRIVRMVGLGHYHLHRVGRVIAGGVLPVPMEGLGQPLQPVGAFEEDS